MSDQIIEVRGVDKSFIRLMETALKDARENKGKTWWELHWKVDDLSLIDIAEDIFEAFVRDVDKLLASIGDDWTEIDATFVAEEAADVANFAMMLADLAKKLEEEN